MLLYGYTVPVYNIIWTLDIKGDQQIRSWVTATFSDGYQAILDIERTWSIDIPCKHYTFSFTWLTFYLFLLNSLYHLAKLNPSRSALINSIHTDFGIKNGTENILYSSVYNWHIGRTSWGGKGSQYASQQLNVVSQLHIYGII